jgi:hypothetical protein
VVGSARVLLLSVMFAGCTARGEDDTAPVDSGDPDLAWTYEGATAEPEWAAADVETAMAEALYAPFPVPMGVLDTFEDVVGEGDSVCPGEELTFEKILGCTASTGWWFAGIAGYGATDQVTGKTPFIQDDLYADMQAMAPDGTRFAMGGSLFQHLAEDGSGLRSFAGFLEGIFIYTDGSLYDPAVDALLDYTAQERAEAPTEIGLDGAISFSGYTLQFDDVTLHGETCPDGATGTIGIRDETEHWYRVAFGDSCTGCGTVTFNDQEEIGEACVAVDRLAGSLEIALLERWR